MVPVGVAQSKPVRGGKEIVEKEIYAEAQAWQFSGIDLPKGSTATITATGKWNVNPQWKKKVGPAGNAKVKAGMFYLEPGAHEGCLLLRSGDTVRAFSDDAQTIVIDTPGKIYFCANDEPTQDGLARFKDLVGGKNGKRFADAIPIDAKEQASGGSGFLDNTGAIKIRIQIEKNSK